MTFSAAAGLVAQQMTILLELRRRLGVVGPIGRIEGALEMLGGVEEVDKLDALGKHAAQKRPVVLRPVGNLDQLQVRTLAQHRLDLRAHHGLERRLLRLRHPAPCAPSRAALPRRHTTTPRRNSPPGTRRPRVFIGAITPSSDTATVHAVSATSSVSSRTLASNWGRCASQPRRERLGQSVQRTLRGRHVAQHTQTPPPASRGTK